MMVETAAVVVGAGVLSAAMGNLLKRLFGPTFDQAGQILACPLAEMHRRLEARLAGAVERVERTGAKPSASPNPAPLTVLVPLLQGASLVDDSEESLAEKWSALLAATAIGTVVPPSYPAILRELSADEARILDVLFAAARRSPTDLDAQAIHAREIVDRLGLDDSAAVVLDNLIRLNVLRFQSASLGGRTRIDSRAPLILTALGVAFLEACHTGDDAV